MLEINKKLLDMEHNKTYKMLREDFEKRGKEGLVEILDKTYADFKLAKVKSLN